MNPLCQLKIKYDFLKISRNLQKRKWFCSLTKVPPDCSQNFHLEIIKCIQKVQETNPLVHCIMNRVTPQKVANCLLAFGASPAIIDNPKEVQEFAQISASTYFNLGLHTSQIDNIKIIEKLRKKIKKDKFLLVVDPIAVGATEYRTSIIKDVLAKTKPNIIKGNTAEIYYLYKGIFLGKGVDCNSSNLEEHNELIESAKNVALKYNSVVVVTAKNDIVVTPFSSEVGIINLDLPILTKITGAGCAVGALCAATLAAYPQNPFIASLSAILLYKLAALKAYQTESFPGSLHHKLIDNIYFIAKNPKLMNFEILNIYNRN